MVQRNINIFRWSYFCQYKSKGQTNASKTFEFKKAEQPPADPSKASGCLDWNLIAGWVRQFAEFKITATCIP